MHGWILRCCMLLLGCWSPAALAEPALLLVNDLTQAPDLSSTAPALATGPGRETVKAWTRAPHDHPQWVELRLAQDWHRDSSPLLAVGGAIGARVVVHAPPDYQAVLKTRYDIGLDQGFSRRAMIYRLPAALRSDQPIYLEIGQPGQVARVWASVDDIESYRAADLGFVRANTFFVSVQFSMLLVILCFWLILRDRVFLYFIAYDLFVVLYAMTDSGEFYSLPGAAWLGQFGFHIPQSMSALGSAFSIWFIIEFAELRSNAPRMARWLGFMRWPFFALAAATWLTVLKPELWHSHLINYLVVVATGLSLASTWVAWRRGNRQAGFFLLAWVPLLSLLMLRVVQLIAALPQPTWLEYGFPASMAYAAIVIAVGLADRTLQARIERDRAAHMAQTDPLSGILNRRAITQRLEEAWEDSGTTALSVLFLDLDHFKRINDNFGHAAGDACIVAVAEAIRAEIGATDSLGRYGGEEFVIVLRDQGEAATAQVAERIVERIASLTVHVGKRAITFTVSIGHAIRDAATGSAKELVENADSAQYQAKRAGRNRAVAFRTLQARQNESEHVNE